MEIWSQIYTVRFGNRKKVHAVVTKYAPMGTYESDRMFGGGFQVVCGLPAKGKAVISPTTVNRRRQKRVTCRSCIKRIE